MNHIDRLTRLVLWLFVLFPCAQIVHAQHPNPLFDATRLAPYYESHVVKIKFRDGERIRLRNGRLVDERFAQQFSHSPLWQAIRNTEARGGTWRRTHVLPESTLDSLRTVGMERSGIALADMNLYFNLTLPPEMSALQAIRIFTGFAEVEWAYLIPKPSPSPAPPDYTYGDASDMFTADSIDFQAYLLPAPHGIDAYYAWEGFDGAGDGVGICDIEYSVNVGHADLSPLTLLGPPGEDPFNSDDHGTEVCGIFGSSRNGYGTTGIAYKAHRYFIPQIPVTTGLNEIDRSIISAIGPLGMGDVLLLEAQTAGPRRDATFPGNSQFGLVPVEWEKPVYDAIQLASAVGITVVEAGCNGQQNLDDAIYITLNQNPGFSPFTEEQRSQAIIVGAGWSAFIDSTISRSHIGFTNFGSRFDLQGWGESVVTTGKGTLYNLEGKHLQYSNNFNGTSSATPIVAGAVAVAQSTFYRAKGRYMFPTEVRELLQSTGTPQRGLNNIGPLPDLRAAIDEIWGNETLRPVMPRITPDPTLTYETPLQVRIEFGPGQNSSTTSLRYTLDGSEPTEDSFEFLPDQGDYIFQRYSNTIKARAFVYNPVNGRLYGSETSSATYTIQEAPPVVAPVTFNPEGQTFETQLFVFLECATPGVEIYYTVDGSVPDQNATLYAGGIVLSSSTRIRARGFKTGHYPSLVITEEVYTKIEARTAPLTPPRFFPAPGSYTGGVSVSLTSPQRNARIHFTTDGSEPNEASSRYVTPLILSANTTIRARSYAEGRLPSVVSEAVYVVDLNPAAPTLTPSAGTFTESVQVEMTCRTPDAIIRYTTNGADPQVYSARYTAPITLNVGEHVVKSRAFLPGGLKSDITTTTFVVNDPSLTRVSTPIISPRGGNYTGGVTVTISCLTDGAAIRYTRDGSEPTANSTLYTNPITLGTGQTQLIRARAFRNNLTPSLLAQMNYNVFAPVGTVDTVKVEPAGGIYHNTVKVTLSTSTPFAQVIYTTDGSDPAAAGRNYASPITISRASTLRAIGSRLAFHQSIETSAQYILQCAAPEITPASGGFRDSVTITMGTITDNAEVRYTTDGSDPTVASDIFAGPLLLTPGTYTIKAIALRNGFETSTITTSIITVAPAPILPDITQQPASQTLATGSDVLFSVTASGTEVLRYQWQKDGTDLAGEVQPWLLIPAIRASDEGSYRVRVWNEAGEIFSDAADLTVTVTTGVEGQRVPESLTLGKPWPQPFREQVSVPVRIRGEIAFHLEILDAAGRRVRILHSGEQQGDRVFTWDGRDRAGRELPAGMYIARLHADGIVHQQMLIRLR